MSSSDAAEHLSPWWELRVHVPAALAEDVAALLVDAGALGVQTLADDAEPQAAWRAHASMGPSSGAAPLGVDDATQLRQARATSAGLQLLASFAGELDAAAVTALAEEALATFGLAEQLAQRKPTRHSDTAWAHAWRQHFAPLKVGRRLWVVPSWQTSFVPPMGSLVLPLDPGMAFGTGQHATTALCLRAIEEVADAGSPPRRVLDVGCGSGILGMAALLLGSEHAVLVDTDAAAVRATEDNLNHAGLAGRFVAQAELPPVDAAAGLVVANILAPVLCTLADALVARLAAGGTLLLSGVLTEQAAVVAAAVDRAGRAHKRRLVALRPLVHGAWVAQRFVDIRGSER